MADLVKDENEMEYTPTIITLVDEDNVEHEFEELDAAEYGEATYKALVPYSEDPSASLEEDAMLLIMRVEIDDDGEAYYSIVEDDEELYNVSKVFEQRLSEEYDFEI